MYRYFVIAFLSAFSLSACAQQTTTPERSATTATTTATTTAQGAEQRVRATLTGLFPGVQPNYVGAAAFGGFQEVLIGGQVLYISNDGNYLLQQVQAIDVKNRTIASSPGLLNYRREQLAQIPRSERIVFSPPNPRYTVSVFTDVDCGYCRKLHQDVPELNRRGIAVEYLAFPRMGLDGRDYRDLVSVWCASDRKTALTDAKSGKPVPAKDCANPVAKQFQLGQRLGVNGTPAIFASNGVQLGGYLTPQQMLEALSGKGEGAAN
ncbi:MAG: DsbC family protein [Xanthomonadaceae bacterium]|jgi:thiol:disulfide interchange protein DsbC|nr:DsbC family protein [Xanthomonadaceae bacterium]